MHMVKPRSHLISICEYHRAYVMISTLNLTTENTTWIKLKTRKKYSKNMGTLKENIR